MASTSPTTISSSGLRSMLEELGLDVKDMHSAVIFIVAPGIVDAVVHTYVRDELGLIKHDGHGDIEDRIVVAHVDWNS